MAVTLTLQELASHLVWCIRSSVVNKWVLYANPFLRFEQESGFLSFRKPSNNIVNYGYRTLGVTTSDTQPVPGPWVTRLVDWLAAATELVEARAPLAPTDSQNNAVVLVFGYWMQSPPAAPQRFGFNAWLNSGAEALLGPHIGRRAEPV